MASRTALRNSRRKPVLGYSFYMWECDAAPTGQYGTYSELLVFVKPDTLLQHLQETSGLPWDLGPADLANCLAAGAMHLWTVNAGQVTALRDFSAYLTVRAQGERPVSLSTLGAHIQRGFQRAVVSLDEAALRAALPPPPAPWLTAREGRVPLRWMVEPRGSRIGDTVALGHHELDSFDGVF